MINLTSEEVRHLDPEIDIIKDTDDPDRFCFICKSGPYKGVAYTYMEVRIVDNEDTEDESEPSHYVEFNFIALENPTDMPLDENFQNKVGNLLVKMIEKLAEKGSEKA